MKKIITTILLLCLVLTFAACNPNETTQPENNAPEITIQQICDAGQADVMLKNHQSVYIQEIMDGEVWFERYLTEEYIFTYIPSEEADFVEFIAEDVCFSEAGDDCVLYVFITPNGVGDFSSDREEIYMNSLGADAIGSTIDSVTQEDGRIIVKSSFSQEALADMTEYGITSAKFEYTLDAQTREFISRVCDYIYEDGTTFCTEGKAAYDVEAPEMAKTFLGYINQTEDLRNITIVSNPGTDKEESKTIQMPKGLIMGFRYSDEFADKCAFFTDAACTAAYDPFADINSDLTIYIKWTE